jgi:hypothetical protein
MFMLFYIKIQRAGTSLSTLPSERATAAMRRGFLSPWRRMRSGKPDRKPGERSEVSLDVSAIGTVHPLEEEARAAGQRRGREVEHEVEEAREASMTEGEVNRDMLNEYMGVQDIFFFYLCRLKINYMMETYSNTYIYAFILGPAARMLRGPKREDGVSSRVDGFQGRVGRFPRRVGEPLRRF